MGIVYGDGIKKAVKEVEPTKIAVAYVGNGWREYLDDKKLEFVIVSPGRGTNPFAVADMVKCLGWNKVLFHDSLHAKVYLGDRSAVVGSANLTKNGLSGSLLAELCSMIDDPVDLADVKLFVDILRDESCRQYDNTAAKKDRLSKMFVDYNVYYGHQESKIGLNAVSFDEFELLSKDQFYVCWYESFRDCQYSEDVVKIERQFTDEIHFLESDDVEVGKWILCWSKKNKSLSWMYISMVFPEGVVDEDYEYTKCAVQMKGALPPEPFKIDNAVESAFFEVLKDKTVKGYFDQSPNLFSLKHSFEGMELLVEKMKEYYRSK